jgi:hypothetical protein
MSTKKQSEQPDAFTAGGEFEGEIREFVRKDVAPWRKRPDAETPAENIKFLFERVAGASLGAIDGVIEELHTVRDLLRTEGDRVQREIAGYADLSQATMASMKIISESMAKWRATTSETTSE